ncbi:hypothetical protein CR513_32174, partial [Mucuna pruriens]
MGRGITSGALLKFVSHFLPTSSEWKGDKGQFRFATGGMGSCSYKGGRGQDKSSLAIQYKGKGASQLEHLDGNKVPRTWNSASLRMMFYQVKMQRTPKRPKRGDRSTIPPDTKDLREAVDQQSPKHKMTLER